MEALKEKISSILASKYLVVKYSCALLVFIIALVNYVSTMAPTASFWDCGEFIATSYILGVPHPPGNPMFLLLGHLFSMVRIIPEAAAQINFLSALSSALTILMLYLVIAKGIEYWFKEVDTFSRIAVVVGGSFCGALATTFSGTFWFNAVEAEVFAAAMFIMLLAIWLALVWMEKYRERGTEKLLLLIMYVMFAGFGVHILVLIVVPSIALLAILFDRELRADWKTYVVGIALSMVIYAITGFIVLLYCFTVILYLKVVLVNKSWPAAFAVFIGLVLVFVGYQVLRFESITTFLEFWSILVVAAFAVMVFVLKEKPRYNGAFWFWIVFLCLIGYSSQAYIPVRSLQNPNIDENNPEKWESFLGFLERKQYGQESMVASMFKRRTTWTEQFGVNPNCGFWGFFRKQYVPPVHYLHFIPLLLGLIGLWVLWRRDWKIALFFTSLFLINTLGLLLYLNFKIDEVRCRDYFYVTGFVFWGFCIGFGVAGLLGYLTRLTRNRRALKRWVVGLVTACLMILPAMPVLCTLKYKDERSIYFSHSRAGNYIPADYAYNMLMTCASGGIIFTNGDNDTFPLWFLQEVLKIRTDVRVANLSLLNTLINLYY